MRNCNDTDPATGQKLSGDSFRSGILALVACKQPRRYLNRNNKCCNSLQPFTSTHDHNDFDSTVKLDRSQLLLIKTLTLTEISI